MPRCLQTQTPELACFCRLAGPLKSGLMPPAALGASSQRSEKSVGMKSLRGGRSSSGQALLPAPSHSRRSSVGMEAATYGSSNQGSVLHRHGALARRATRDYLFADQRCVGGK